MKSEFKNIRITRAHVRHLCELLNNSATTDIVKKVFSFFGNPRDILRQPNSVTLAFIVYRWWVLRVKIPLEVEHITCHSTPPHDKDCIRRGGESSTLSGSLSLCSQGVPYASASFISLYLRWTILFDNAFLKGA